MEKNYDPKTIEEKWYKWCLDNKVFHGDRTRGGEPYCIVIPPPNVTGVLHMGHALNNTIQDILIRWQQMQGRNVVWVPGTDHAGIATQNVVERSLLEQGKTREDLGRAAFLERVWKWREEYGGTIINQLKKLGCACDWDRERFTMDEGLSDAVAEVFVRLFEKGLIYRANYIINWCPRCQTALSDEESEHEDVNGKLYYIRYAIKDGGPDDFITVATTRPETLLGDVAVAVNPNDPRYSDLLDKTLILPALGREIPVISDEFVDPEFGTGMVKVTPAHDPNDFEMGLRHKLDPINIMDEGSIMNDAAGSYKGLDRFECRKKLVADLIEAGQVEKVLDHQHAVGHCYRCSTMVEPRLSRQWFVKMKPLAEPALKVVKQGKIKFVPDRWTKVYSEWMENIRDWCISRQIWWGHRIPVFYCDSCDHMWAQKGVAEKCPECGADDIRQDEDVLDTWFSSWLWPFSTFGWPDENENLKFYYPTHDIVTASEIIFFWIARMVMSGLEFMGEIPFSTVYIHGTVRDDQGRKMSKSLGNAINPLDIIENFSADALRYSLIMITATGQDVYLSDDKFEIGRNFGTKLWNASRFMKMHEDRITDDRGQKTVGRSCEFNKDLLTSDDMHILAKLDQAVTDCTDNLQKYRFNDAAHVLYEFVWHQYCDWYVEYSKEAFYGEDDARKEHVLAIMNHVLSNSLRLLHPFMPFITEELWHVMGFGAEDETIMHASWPEALGLLELEKKWGITPDIVEYVDDKHVLIRAGRTIKADYGVLPTAKTDYIIKPVSEKAQGLFDADKAQIQTLLRAGSVKIDVAYVPEQAVPSMVSKLGVVYMPLEGAIDPEEEAKRLSTQLDKVDGDLLGVCRKLENENFVNRAPEAVVERQRILKVELTEKSEKLRLLLENVAAMSK